MVQICSRNTLLCNLDIECDVTKEDYLCIKYFKLN